MHQAIVLHSGGLDSTVCLLKAIEEGKSPLSLGFDYGQRHRIEMDYAAHQCRKFGIERRVLHIAWDKPRHEIPVDRSLAEITNGVSSAFLPARNIVFFSLACAHAAGTGSTEVWAGINAVDFSGYPDCTPAFVSSFTAMLLVAMPGAPAIVTPLLSLNKPEIAEEARRLGLLKSDTWSCYQPVYAATGPSRCGRCDACILNDYAWEKLPPHA